MRFMVIVKANKDTEASVMPTSAELEAMGKYNEQLIQAGIMTGGDGLKSSAHGARIYFKGSQRTVVDGPFTETKELIAGYWTWQCKDLAEAIEWAKKCPNPTGDESQLEIRQFFEMEDFGVEMTPELREQEKSQLARAAELTKK